MMKKNKREKRKSKFNAPIVVLVFTILLILFFVMAYMLFHSRSIASLEAEKSVIEKLYGCDGIRDYDYKKEIFHNKYTVDMTYVLAVFFNKPRNERYFNYMSDRNVQYFFGKRFPLDKIGFETVNKYVEKEKNPYQLF